MPKARTDELDHNDDIDPAEALRYLTGLSDGAHTGECRCGYPHGLRGEAIAEEARIFPICDVFDIMRHSRPWHSSPMSNQAALSELKRGAGRQFDGQFVDTLSISFDVSLGSTTTSMRFWPKVLINSNTYERALGWKRSSRAAGSRA